MVGRESSEGTSSNSEVKLCFKSQDGCRVYFSVDDDTNIQDVLKAYCEEKQVEYSTVVFLHDGKRLRRKGTVNQVGLVDQAKIEVMMHQIGGGPSADAV